MCRHSSHGYGGRPITGDGLTGLSVSIYAVQRTAVGTVMISRPNTYLSPRVASLRGKHIAGECPIPVIPLRRDDLPIRGTRRDNDTPPSPGEGGKFLRGSSPGLPVGTSICPTCISSTHNCPRLLNNREQSTSTNTGRQDSRTTKRNTVHQEVTHGRQLSPIVPPASHGAIQKESISTWSVTTQFECSNGSHTEAVARTEFSNGSMMSRTNQSTTDLPSSDPPSRGFPRT